MLGSINLELFSLYIVLVSVLFGKYQRQYAMVHPAVQKSTFVGFGITMCAYIIGVFTEFEVITMMKVGILGNCISLWAYMVKHLLFAYKASLPSRPVAKVTEEVVTLTEEEMDSLGISPKVKEKLLANLDAGVYDTVNIGLTDKDPMSKYSDDGSVI